MAVLFLRKLAIVGFAILLAFALATKLEAQSDSPLPLTELKFVGLERYRTEEMVRMSGLTIGQLVTRTQLTEIARRLSETGFFTELRYRYATTAAGISAEFTVRETAWTVPVIYDNFLSIPDAELTAAVAAEVPGFAEKAADGGLANDRIAAALERAASRRGMRGRVEARQRLDTSTGNLAYVFAINDPATNFAICAVRYPGAAAVAERELQSLSAFFVGDAYSRATLEAFSKGTLTRHYQERGFWSATFDPPSGATGAGCSGVTVSIRVHEDVPFRWAGAAWTGVTVFTAAQLDELMGLDPGDVANVLRIDDGLRRVDAAYEKSGYLVQKHTLTPELDKATRRATFRIAIAEGAQFRMGAFAVEGVPERDAATIAERWRIKSGDVFDGSYLREFLREHLKLLQERPDRLLIAPDVRLNQEAAVVDVTFRPRR